MNSMRPSRRSNQKFVLGNEFKNNGAIQNTLVQQRRQGGAVQFHAGDTHYATADLLSGSERELRQQRRSLFSGRLLPSGNSTW